MINPGSSIENHSKNICPKIPVALFVSPERSSERDYVITDSVRSMYVVCT